MFSKRKSKSPNEYLTMAQSSANQLSNVLDNQNGDNSKVDWERFSKEISDAVIKFLKAYKKDSWSRSFAAIMKKHPKLFSGKSNAINKTIDLMVFYLSVQLEIEALTIKAAEFEEYSNAIVGIEAGRKAATTNFVEYSEMVDQIKNGLIRLNALNEKLKMMTHPHQFPHQGVISEIKKKHAELQSALLKLSSPADSDRKPAYELVKNCFEDITGIMDCLAKFFANNKFDISPEIHAIEEMFEAPSKKYADINKAREIGLAEARRRNAFINAPAVVKGDVSHSESLLKGVPHRSGYTG